MCRTLSNPRAVGAPEERVRLSSFLALPSDCPAGPDRGSDVTCKEGTDRPL